MLFNRDKIILDLCGGTGSWSKPYSDSGYDVKIITYPDNDVRWYQPPEKVYGILAAPPCTHFTNSGAQYWEEKDRDGRTQNDLNILAACCRIIIATNPHFWVIENPVGRMKYWLGPPKMSFNPCDYGDNYTKKTLLWGRFNWPYKTNRVEPEFVIAKNGDRYSKINWYTGGKSDKTKTKRSVTPPGFARAFFEANQ